MIQINMAGDRPLYYQETLASVLQALQANPLFSAETWGLDERSNKPYEESKILLVANGKSSPFVLQLRRKKKIQHTTTIRLSNRPGVIVNVPPNTPSQDWFNIFELGDSLASAYQPDIAWIHLFADLELPFSDEHQKTQFIMDSGVVGSGSNYDDDGPGGLGIRTYIGPRLIEIFGRDLLLNTPASVTEMNWGGVRIDLVEEPWSASQVALVSAWKVAMEHLRQAEVFSEVDIDEDDYVYFTRGRRFTTGARK
jgi:hypothetical protein